MTHAWAINAPSVQTAGRPAGWLAAGVIPLNGDKFALPSVTRSVGQSVDQRLGSGDWSVLFAQQQQQQTHPIARTLGVGY